MLKIWRQKEKENTSVDFFCSSTSIATAFHRLSYPPHRLRPHNHACRSQPQSLSLSLSMAEVGWEDIQVSANQEFDAIKIGQRLSCILSYIFIVLTRNEEGAVLKLVNLGFQVKGLLSENVTSNMLLNKFINVVKIIYKEFKDMKEQETLNQAALQQEELEELEVKNKFLGRDCFVTKIFSEIKDLAAIVTEQSGVSFSVRLKKKQILGAVENLDAQVLIVKNLLRDSIKNSSGQMEIDISQVWKKSNPKFTSIEIEIEWVRLMAIGRLVEYEDIVAVQKRKQYVSLAAVEAEVVALRNAISLSQRKSGRYCSVVNWLNTNANDSSNWSAMEGIKFHALRLGRLISHSLCHLFFGIPKNEQITERFVSFFNQLEAVSGQENNDMVVSAKMIRLYKLACSEIEEGIKESPMKNTFSTTTIVDAISKVLDGFFHLTLRLEALVSSPLLLVSKTIHHHVSSLEVFLDICEKDATNLQSKAEQARDIFSLEDDVLSLVGLDMELHIEDEWRE